MLLPRAIASQWRSSCSPEVRLGSDDEVGVPISYVVSNASSYAYVDDRRPTPSAASLSTPGIGLAAPGVQLPAFLPYADAKNCTGYDSWPYGLKNRIGYAARLKDDQLRRQLTTRPVTYLLGEADVLPLGVFDTSCPAQAQGPTRLARGLAFSRYVKENHGANHDAIVVPFCSDSSRCMFTSDVALPLIFPT
jgi:hypothetical protein